MNHSELIDVRSLSTIDWENIGASVTKRAGLSSSRMAKTCGVCCGTRGGDCGAVFPGSQVPGLPRLTTGAFTAGVENLTGRDRQNIQEIRKEFNIIRHNSTRRLMFRNSVPHTSGAHK